MPLNEKKIKRIAIIGPNADNEATLLGNYNGTPLETVTPLKGLKLRLGNRVAVDYYPGTGIVAKLKEGPSLSEVAKAAGRADIIIFVGGLTADYEGEAGDAGAGGYAGFASGDRTTLDLPPVQIEMLKALKKTGKPLVVVNMSGSTMSYDWESRNATALIQAWYGGQAIGDALADILFGTYSPSGRMPLTAYCSDEDMPAKWGVGIARHPVHNCRHKKLHTVAWKPDRYHLSALLLYDSILCYTSCAHGAIPPCSWPLS